jgi:hypothetical protein
MDTVIEGIEPAHGGFTIHFGRFVSSAQKSCFDMEI